MTYGSLQKKTFEKASKTLLLYLKMRLTEPMSAVIIFNGMIPFLTSLLLSP